MFMTMNDILSYFALKSEGKFDEIFDAISHNNR